MMAVDNKHAIVLILLDLSAVFQTVDYDIPLTRLEQPDVVLAWFRSYMYLTQMSQLVSIEALFLLFDVPQGSVLGPLLFVLYTHPLGLISRRYGIGIHMYADDTQLHICNT